jgi:hypothetical protein
MRRLKLDDPSRDVYEAYVAELDSRWATATEVPRERVLQMVKSKQQAYQIECAEFDTLALSLCENLATSVKEATIDVEKRVNVTGGLLTDGTIVALGEHGPVTKPEDLVAAIRGFEQGKDRFTDSVLSHKIAALDGIKRK